jgi:mRNA interferase MazF
MKRGEVWWASLPDPVGSAPGFRRPVLIIQSNAFNDSRIATVVVAALTTNLARANAPGNIALTKSDSGLSKASVVNISQLLTADRVELTERVRTLPALAMRQVDDGLRLILGL